MRKKICSIIFILIIFINVLINPVYGEELISYDESMQQAFEHIEAPNVLVGNTETGELLYGKNIDEKIYPASLTKLMTAILVVENCELDEIATVSENAVKSVPSGYVNANLQVGEELTIEDLLYVMLIPSANDAANVLAEYVGGNIESFATMMNTRAKEIGCTNTNFTNPSGLHQEEHTTTARDLLLIANEAYKKETIRKIICVTNYSLPQTNMYSGNQRVFTSTNYLILPSLTKFYTESCLGGKTGYTEYAKNCVVEYARKEDIPLTIIVLGANAKVKGQKFLDAKEMLEYIFQNYNINQIVKKDDIYETIKIKKATKKTEMLKVKYKEDISILVKKGQIVSNKEVEYNNTEAPIKAGDIVGNIKYNYNGKEYRVELIAESDVEKSAMPIIITVILIILAITLFIIYSSKKIKTDIGNHGKNI